MAKKFFIATCEKKVSKHPVKDGKVFTIPVEAETQADAKEFAKAQVEKLDVTFEGKSETYSDWFKNPNLEKVTKEEFNAVVLEHEAKQPCNEELTDGGELQQRLPSAPYPTLGQDGFYDTKDPLVEESSFIYSSETDNMQAAKVFVLCVGHSQYAYGFRYKFGDFDKHERMNLDRIEEKRDDAVDKAIGRLENFLDYQDEFGSEEHKPFISALMKHDFYRAFLEPSELFLEAISKHPDVQSALEQHGDFYEVVEGHFADIWPLDKSPEQAIEHINSMVTISVLYDLEAFTESFKPYLPSVFSEKTKESMKHIEEVIDKPAANDSNIEARCWKAALPLTDDLHVVIAIQDRGDEGWQNAFEGNLKTERVFGDANDFSGEFAVTRKEAIKMAGQAITDALYKYDSSLSLAKLFMKTPYIQGFEESCIEVAVKDAEQGECSPIETAIRERLARRPTANLTEGEVKLALDSIMPHVTEQTYIDELVDSIGRLEWCGSLFSEDDAARLVTGCTVKMEKKPKGPTHNLENEHECFIAEILSRIGDEGSSYLTSDQYEEAGEKLNTVIDELVNWHNGEREHNGKHLTFVKDKTLENISQIDFDDPNEVAKTFLNIRSLRAVFRENIELIENSKPTSETQKTNVEHPVLLKAITERLANENHAVTPERAYTQLVNIITENTDIEALAEYIKQLKNPVIIWHSTESVNLVMKFTGQPKADGNNELSSGNNEQKEAQKLPEQGKKEPTDGNGKPKVTKNAPLPESANDEHLADSDSNTNGSNVPQNIVEQEPANDPTLSSDAVDEKITQLESKWSKDEREAANMRIWSQVHRTDREFTSKDHKGLTSINTQYRIMQMTKAFGMCGIGWGYEDERWIEKFAELPDGTQEQIAHVKISLWVKVDGVKSEPITHYGSCKVRYLTSGYGGKVQSIHQDEEYYKKAESDAMGKAMSMLGVCADVYLGEHDDAHIQTLTSAEIESKEKLRHLEEEERIRKEVTEALKAIKHELETVTSKADVDALENKGAAKIIALPGVSEKQKAFKGECTRTLHGYCEKAIARLAPKKEAK